ncbi:hypothetical protein [Pleionea litopenaei]|uniref:DUF4328 domain-containing protein n=1 Tax=Pleionea litopenaei TaxID=3070815 RepID=A0AA51X5X6_9GAMM|nr:hypothetical protein [Pleionea sp. HL-JVS1]WMS86662.1 hypothetical protein Q9312_15680 [Pleionea sp. HL-JVS1]
MEMSDQDAMALMASLGAVFFVILAVFIAIFCLFLYSLHKVLANAGEENRGMQPGLVWLNLIPVFNWGWMIYTVIKVAEAINNKHKAHGITDPGNGAKTVGLIYSISVLCGLIPIIGIIAPFVALISWIIYWVKISGYNSSLPQLQGSADAAA